MKPSLQETQESSRAKGCFPLHCNKCRLPLEAVAFVCSCNCVFCDTCTEEHFCRDSRCPVCKRYLQEDEFFDVVVTDQPAVAAADDRAKLDAIFKSQRSDALVLSFQDVCANLMREQDSLMNNTQMFLTQLVREADQKIGEGDAWKRKAVAYQKQNHELKQQYQKIVRELQDKNKLQEIKLKEQNNRIRELQMELERVALGRPTVSAGSSFQAPPTAEKATRSLPFVRRMHNKEKEDMAKERSVHEQKRPILGQSSEGHGSYSSHSNRPGSHGRGGYQPYPTQHHRY
ncbi:hypothetical protein IV203_017023 [Nitzschia inconspicua]|uniref:RING-type domain-containing protein n=1 Tax=Nitzschia inconspicua TaxID=303405 RepID=A0A9K3KSM4_9STRA|nr:hypothetical protein IV203_017023 [Nitzschia inconspicua]